MIGPYCGLGVLPLGDPRLLIALQFSKCMAKRSRNPAATLMMAMHVARTQPALPPTAQPILIRLERWAGQWLITHWRSLLVASRQSYRVACAWSLLTPGSDWILW